MSPIWINFALMICGVLLFTIVGVTVVLCLLDSHEGPRVLHVERRPVMTRQLSPPAKELSERLTQRRSREAEKVKQAAQAQEIGTGVLRKIDDLYEMVHGNKHHER